MAKKAKKQRTPASGDVATNRRARHKFEPVEKMETGIVRFADLFADSRD